MIAPGYRGFSAYASGSSCRGEGSHVSDWGRLIHTRPPDAQGEAGKAVLSVAERTLVAQGRRKILALRFWPGYRFYHAGRGFLVDRWTHVLGILLSRGYELQEGGAFLQADTLDESEREEPDPIPGAEIVVAGGSNGESLTAQHRPGRWVHSEVGRPV